jgi:hypothetical protein
MYASIARTAITTERASATAAGAVVTIADEAALNNRLEQYWPGNTCRVESDF